MALEFATIGSALSESAVRNLKHRLAGELLQPGDHDYDSTRQIWNGNQDRHPGLIVRAADAIDVIRAVNFAREQGMAVAVRSGGHSIPGQSTLDGGMMIDLSLMKGIHMDPERRVARVQPGVTWGEYAAQAQAHGLATSSGDMSSVGVAGLALGGGIGWMVRKYGLTVDHLLSVDVVTADGRLVTASETENPELFWGLRGGGGNFGIATSFELKLQPAGMILGGAIFYSADRTQDVIRAYAAYASQAPDELTTIATVMPAPPLPFIPASLHGKPIIIIMLCYVGDLEEGQRVVEPLRQIETPIADVVGPMPYPTLFTFTAEGTQKGLMHADRSTYLQEMNEDVLNTLAEFGQRMTSPASMLQLRVLGGAMARVPADATAFAHRDKQYMLTIINMWDRAHDSDQHRAWTEEAWSRVQPHGAGVYVNFLENEGEARVREAYSPTTYDRLAALKRQYDPTNFFRLNQNIRPGGRA